MAAGKQAMARKIAQEKRLAIQIKRAGQSDDVPEEAGTRVYYCGTCKGPVVDTKYARLMHGRTNPKCREVGS